MNKMDKMDKIDNTNKYINNFQDTSLPALPALPSLIEPFDGIKKHNSKTIFGLLLLIIVIDFVVDLM
jgi:hypothetical protein